MRFDRCLRGLTAIAALLAVSLALVACAAPAAAPGEADEHEAEYEDALDLAALAPAALGEGEKMRVVASTSIVGDVVGQVGGEHIDLTALIGLGQDPHSYEPAARDMALVAGAHVIFVHGMGLEGGLLQSLTSAGGDTPLVPVSAGVAAIEMDDEHDEDGEREEDDHDHAEGDPHTWTDPANVIVWAENIAAAFSALDPANEDVYRANATDYIEELRALDATIAEQVTRISPEARKLVTNHETFGYFARRYGFEVVGAVYLGTSQLAEPAAGDLARLIETIRAEEVPAIFVETTVSDALAQVIVEEVGHEVSVYTLYTDSLGAPGSGADSYIGMMRANIDSIVEGLAGG